MNKKSTNRRINEKIEKLIYRALREIEKEPTINTSALKNVVTTFRTWYSNDHDDIGDVYIIDNIPKKERAD